MLNESDYRTLYPLVKGFVVKYECGGDETRLDDDVFHETCFRVLKLMRGKEEWIGISFEDIQKYVCKSYRINCLREKMYFRNSHEINCNDFSSFENLTPDSSSLSTLDEIGKQLEKAFSPELRLLLAKHIYQNISISELEKESGRKNLKYQFKKMKEFLKNNIMVKELKCCY